MIEDLFVPVVTPFDDSGGVDPAAFAAHCAWTTSQGAGGVVLFGTTGEGPSLSVDEKIGLARGLLSELPASQVIGTVTENSPTEALRCLRGYDELGLAAALVLPPFYFRDGIADGLVRYFERLVDAVELPFLTYHIPGLAPAVPLQVFAELDIWGAKDSGGDLDFTRAVVAAGKSVMVGAESTIVDAFQAGAAGTIAGMGNILPSELARTCAAVRAGDEAEARRLLSVVLRVQAAIIDVAPELEWVAAFKQIAGHLHGIDLGGVRDPLSSRKNYLTEEVLRALLLRGTAAA